MDRRLPLVALLLAALLVAACGGAASPSPSAPAATSGPATATASAAATDGPSATASEAASEAPTGSGSGIDLGAAAEALEGIDSYKLSMTLEGATSGSIQAVVVREPQPAQEFTMSIGGTRQRVIIVGDEAWMDPGTGTFAPVPGELAAQLSASFDPVTMLGGFNNPVLQAGLERVGEEDRNGVQTVHYHLDADSAAGQLASIPPGGEMDVWLAEQGYVVSFEARNLNEQVTFLRMDVTDINAATNVVEAPG